MPKDRHLLIGGTGRSGTSFLVKLLHRCGLETGLDDKFNGSMWHADAQAGLENKFKTDEPSPYVIKSPWLYQYVRQSISASDFIIDEVIIPVRELVTSSASRIIIDKQQQIRFGDCSDITNALDEVGYIAGGGVFSLNVIDQSRILAVAFHQLVEILVHNNIPMRFISYPRFSEDAFYAYDMLQVHISKYLDFQSFESVHTNLKAEGSARVEEELIGLRISDSAANPDNISDKLSLIAALREVDRLKKELAVSEYSNNSLQSSYSALIEEHNRLKTTNHENYSKLLNAFDKLSSIEKIFINN